jgi:hypothetical protein
MAFILRPIPLQVTSMHHTITVCFAGASIPGNPACKKQRMNLWR